MKPASQFITGLFRARPMSREKADTLLLLASCTLVLLPHLAHLPFWVGPACVGLLAWRAWVTFRGNRMPPRWLLLSVAVVAMAGIFATFRTLFGREAGIAMLALLLALKTLEMHAKRDLFVVLFLSFFLILSSFIYSQSMGTAVMTIVAVVTILTTQLSFQYTGAVPPLRRRLRLGATILALAVPLTLVLFLLFPRIQGPLWGMPGDAAAGRSGLSESMAPGNISRLALSDDVAFRVRFYGTVPQQSSLYWRGIVLGDYDGRTWSPLHTRVRALNGTSARLRGESIRYQLTLEPHGKRWIFALDIPETVPSIPTNPTRITPELELRSRNPVAERLRYEGASRLDVDLQADELPQVLSQWLKLPDGFNPRTLEYAARLRSQTKDKSALVNEVLRHFHEENFRYTLEPPPLGKHVVDEFLFDTRAGFCEHYSGAFVVLMRALGIPARVVTGYQGGEMNATDGYMTIRQSDAHAWAEVWLAPRGWVRVDPTAAVAPDRVERNLASVIPRSAFGGLITLDPTNNLFAAQWLKMRQRLDAVSNAWNQWVLNYTPEKQKDFIRSLGFDNVDWHTLTGIMFILGSATLAATVLPLILKQQKTDPIEAAYARLCRMMARRGLPRAIHEGPRDYAARIGAAGSPLQDAQKDAAVRFLGLYETVRYGNVPDGQHPSATLSKLKSLLAECR